MGIDVGSMGDCDGGEVGADVGVWVGVEVTSIADENDGVYVGVPDGSSEVSKVGVKDIE